MGHDVSVVSLRHLSGVKLFHSVDDAISSEQPDYVVIANKTSDHRNTLIKVSDALSTQNLLNTRILVEKPLFHTSIDHPFEATFKTYVGYHLRFHPIMKELKKRINQNKCLTAFAYVGQYLPLFRPQRDYRESYSSKLSEGGGALRDLSHELDYLSWFFGKPNNLFSLSGKISSLDIDSDDAATVLMSMQHCQMVMCELNYLDRPGKRFLNINTRDATLFADLIDNSLMVDNHKMDFSCDKDTPYREMHRSILEGESSEACTFSEGQTVMNLIKRIEGMKEAKQMIL